MECRKVFRSSKGKTVIVRAVIKGERVKEISVTGDFFLEEEGALEELKSRILVLPLKDVDLNLKGFLGLDPQEIREALLSCIGDSPQE
jgi:hypothetical protein